MNKKIKYYILGAILFVLFILATCFYIKFTSIYISNSIYLLEGKTIVIDIGHGGSDPGKVGTLSNEDDLNLSIGLKLKNIFTSLGANVFLTRNDENGLKRNITDEWNKLTDMKIRREIINSNNADIMISIHMNSHTDTTCKGAQIFYLKGDNESKQLSEQIKMQTDKLSDYSAKRELKERDDLYILKENNMPSCIVECGFISNDEEEILLNDENYQEQIAWYISIGASKYLMKINN